MPYRILADGIAVSNDTRKTGRNNNDLIIGPSGTGKSRGYVLPNILQANGSIIVSDSKGMLRRKAEKYLRREGYRVVCLDFKDCSASYGYNPFDFIGKNERTGRYHEQDILTVAAALVPVRSRHDPFWDGAARMFLECLTAYTLECLPDVEHNLNSVETLLCEMGTGQFKTLMDELRELAPDSFALRRWDLFRGSINADKMYSSIVGILAERLSALSFDGTKAMFTRKGRIKIKEIGEQKTAVFINISDTDHSLDSLVSLFYTQTLQVLCNEADRHVTGRLKVPVRLILDDFAANLNIPGFDKIISVIRSREISASIIIQSISQLEDIYGKEKSMTIINNCDTCLYLGGQDVDTAKYIAVKADKSASTILSMPLHQAWLFLRGENPKLTAKYRLESHPRYRCLAGELPVEKTEGKEQDCPGGIEEALMTGT